MSGIPKKRATRANAPAAGAAKKSPGRAAAKPSKSTRPAATQPRARKKAVSRVPPKRLPAETTAAAVERALAELDVKPIAKRAVQVSTVRRLAEALDAALPTDRPKISKELAARWAELLAEVNPPDPEHDWTQGSGAAEGGNTPQSGPANKRR